MSNQINQVENGRNQPKGRFNWVRRLMNGQNRTNGEFSNERDVRYNNDYYKPTKPRKTIRIDDPREGNSDHDHDQRDNYSHNIPHTNDNPDIDTGSIDTDDIRSGSYNSDDVTTNSDNISTIPLKSIVSVPSTQSPSVLSNDNNHDNQSYNPSTAETSIAPSSVIPFNPLLFNRDRDGLPTPGIDRDSESIVTLASSTRRIRRRSLETNSSTVGIPPASIMERLSVQPTTTNSAYANSLNPNDITSVHEDTASYKDDASSSSMAKSSQ